MRPREPSAGVSSSGSSKCGPAPGTCGEPGSTVKGPDPADPKQGVLAMERVFLGREQAWDTPKPNSMSTGGWGSLTAPPWHAAYTSRARPAFTGPLLPKLGQALAVPLITSVPKSCRKHHP